MTVLALHCAATWVMVGVIWIVQLVHYPSFHDLAGLSPERFRAAMENHVRRITWVVLPAMAIEAITACWFLGQPLGQVGAALLAVCWVSTGWFQVPAHNRLARGADVDAIRRLVRTNWIRTVAWSLRGGLVVWLATT